MPGYGDFVIAPDVKDGSAVYKDGAIWRLADAGHYPDGWYEGGTIVVYDGQKTSAGFLEFDVVFRPVQVGAVSGKFTLEADSPDSPKQLSLTGSGLGKEMVLDVGDLPRTWGIYGFPLEAMLVGKVIPEAIATTALATELKKVLCYHPLVEGVRKVAVKTRGDDAEISFTVDTTTGEELAGTLDGTTLSFKTQAPPKVARDEAGNITIGSLPRGRGIYGSRLESIVIGQIPTELKEKEIAREIKEVLQRHPYVLQVRDMTINLKGDDVEVSFSVKTTMNEIVTVEV